MDFVCHGLWGNTKAISNAYGWGLATEAEGLVAGFVYHNFVPEAGTIEITAYASRHDWTNRDRVRRIFAYPFEELGVRLVVARTSEHNRPPLRIWKALGATFVRLPELRGVGEDEIVTLLSRKTWEQSKFARGRNGQT